MQKQNLLELIEQKRSELYQAAAANGFSSAIAIQFSQELDQLLNEYERRYIKNPMN